MSSQCVCFRGILLAAGIGWDGGEWAGGRVCLEAAADIQRCEKEDRRKGGWDSSVQRRKENRVILGPWNVEGWHRGGSGFSFDQGFFGRAQLED